MPVTISVKEIKVDPASETVSPKMDRASVEVLVSRGSSRPLEMSFSVRNYDSLDAVAEEVRQQILAFATELQEAAQKPLLGTRRSR